MEAVLDVTLKMSLGEDVVVREYSHVQNFSLDKDLLSFKYGDLRVENFREFSCRSKDLVSLCVSSLGHTLSVSLRFQCLDGVKYFSWGCSAVERLRVKNGQVTLLPAKYYLGRVPLYISTWSKDDLEGKDFPDVERGLAYLLRNILTIEDLLSCRVEATPMLLNASGFEGDEDNVRTEVQKGEDNVKPKHDAVNSPSHYTWLRDVCGVEVIDIVRHMGFNLGNAVKYVLRSGRKSDASMSDKDKRIEDLRKAVWYLNDEIARLEKE